MISLITECIAKSRKAVEDTTAHLYNYTVMLNPYAINSVPDQCKTKEIVKW